MQIVESEAQAESALAGLRGALVSALQYFLSKRTDVYIDLIYQRASGAVAAIEGTSGASSSHTQFLTVTGIRQKF